MNLTLGRAPLLAVAFACFAAAHATAQQTTAPSATTTAPIDGETLFATTCGWCHADGGRQAGKGPKLANTKRTDDFIVYRIKHGKEGAMPAFGTVYNDEQIAQIIRYIRGLKEDQP